MKKEKSVLIFTLMEKNYYVIVRYNVNVRYKL